MKEEKTFGECDIYLTESKLLGDLEQGIRGKHSEFVPIWDGSDHFDFVHLRCKCHPEVVKVCQEGRELTLVFQCNKCNIWGKRKIYLNDYRTNGSAYDYDGKKHYIDSVSED